MSKAVTKVPAPRFILHDKKSNPTYIKLTYRPEPGGKRLVWSTGEVVDPKYWNVKRNRAKASANYPQGNDLNERLNEIEKHCINVYREFWPCSYDEFKDELSYRTKRKDRPATSMRTDDLLQYAKGYVERRRADPQGKRGTWKNLQTAFNNLQGFAQYYRLEKIPFDKVDKQLHLDLVNYYISVRGFSNNYTHKQFQIIRQFMAEAEADNLHQNRRFKKGFTVKKRKRKQVYLRQSELRAIERLDLSEDMDLQKARDYYLIGCYTGQGFQDFTAFCPSDFQEVEPGVWVFVRKRTKVDEYASGPVIDELQPLLEKYGLLPTEGSPKWRPYETHNMSFNRRLKRIAEMAGIDAPTLVYKNEDGSVNEDGRLVPKFEAISSHSARRTFVSLARSWGIDDEDIMSVTAHTNAKQMKEYDQRDLADRSARIAKLIKEGREGKLRAV